MIKLRYVFSICIILLGTHTNGKLLLDQTALDSLKNRLQTYSDSLDLAKVYYNIADIYYSNDPDSSLHYSYKYLELSKKLQDTVLIADAYNNIAYVYDLIGDLPHAIENYKLALENFQAVKDSTSFADCCINLGYSISFGIDQTQSLNYFLKAMEVAEDIKDTGILSYAYYNIGTYYDWIEDYTFADYYYNKSLDMDLSQNDSGAIALSYLNLATLNVRINKAELAEELLASSLSYFPQENSMYDQAYYYSSMVDLYLAWDNIALTSQYLDILEKILDQNDFLFLEAYFYYQKGDLLFMKGNYSGSLNYLDQAIDNYKKLKASESLPYIYDTRAEALSRTGMHEQAYNTILLSRSISDSLKYGAVAGMLSAMEQEKLYRMELQNARLSAELEAKTLENSNLRIRSNFKIVLTILILLTTLAGFVVYFMLRLRKNNMKLHMKNEYINSQRLLLESNNDKLKLSEEELRKLNATKDKFFSIIAHDLKNPLSAIIGFSDLLLTDKKYLESANLVPIMESMNTSANYGFSLLENLLVWARSQTGNIVAKPKEISIDKIIDSLISSFNVLASGKNIHLIKNGESAPTIFADENMITTVLRNLIHNSVKFSHKNSTIEILTHIENSSLVISVKDEGVGLSDEEQEKLFSIDSKIRKVGTGNEEGSGLGLILCKEFILKNNGKIWVEGGENIGCKFSFSLPLYTENILSDQLP